MTMRTADIRTGFVVGEHDAIRVRRLEAAIDSIGRKLTELYKLAHTSKMPDEDGTNTDHDKRYITKARLLRLIGGSPHGVTKLVAPDGSPDPAVSVSNGGNVTVVTLTPNRLVATNSVRELSSVESLTDWLHGTDNRVLVEDSEGGTVTLSIPQDYHTEATPQLARLGLGTPADSNVLLLGTTTYSGEAVRILNTSLAAGQDISISIGKQLATGKTSQLAHHIDSDGVHQTWLGPNGFALRLTERPTLDYSGTVFLTSTRQDGARKAVSIRGYQFSNDSEPEGYTVIYSVSK